jgi:quinol-cytochrome oxidoreductase complex cytochrome b subunit
MSPLGKYYVGAAIVAVLAFILPLPSLIAWLIVLGVLGAPVVAYFMLDESQRSRLRRIRRRQIGG